MSISLYTIADDYRHAFNHITELLEETEFDAESKKQIVQDYLFIQCLKTGSTQIRNAELIICIKANPPKVIIDNENSIPDIYKKVIETVNISKSAIATAIKNGLEVNGAHLESSQRLDIK